MLREKEALRESVAALQLTTDRATEASEAATRDRDEAKLAAAAAAQRAQQEREVLAEAEGENEGLRTRLQMSEEELAAVVADADQVGLFGVQSGARGGRANWAARRTAILGGFQVVDGRFSLCRIAARLCNLSPTYLWLCVCQVHRQ